MLNYSLHLSGPKLRALIQLANGDYHYKGGIVVGGLVREGLAMLKPIPSRDAEDITIDAPFITDKGLTVLGLIETDIEQYMLKVMRGKKKG